MRSRRSQWIANHQMFYLPFGFSSEEEDMPTYRLNTLEELLLSDSRGFPYNAWEGES